MTNDCSPANNAGSTLIAEADAPNPIDQHVGSRLRFRRTLLGISQERLGETVGITFQQLQKYERGSNRISASRLYNLSQALNVPVSFFFDEIPPVENNDDTRKVNAAEHSEHVSSRETLELVRAYYRISNEPLRRHALDLIKAIATETNPEPRRKPRRRRVEET